MERLPVDHRGYPVPWFVAWLDEDGNAADRGEGAPDFRLQQPGALAEAWNKKRCWLCGERTGRHVAFVVGSMCAANRVTAEPPSHRDCAEFAAKACPFLARPHARRRPISSALDVSQPGIPILRNPGVCAVWVIQRRDVKVVKVEGGHLVELGDPSEVHWYTHGATATREQCEASIEAGLPALRLELGADRASVRLLEQQLAKSKAVLPRQGVFVP
jgi:hypothetical protein